jgi:hypothetical protein
MKRSIIVLFLLLSSLGYSQSTINNYKYVIVPGRFTFLKENDQYGLNSVTKNLLQAKGFTVFFDNNELPVDLANNKCNALSADVLDKSGMFSTTLVLVLKDCHGNVVFSGKPGKSREKDFSTGYNMALTDAFASLGKVPYTYKGPVAEQVQPVAVATTVAPPAVTEPITAPAKAIEINNDAGTLYAQAIPNGYQLVDNTPKKVLTLLKTSAENYFIASNNTVNGIVLKINEDWFFEYYEDGKLVSKKLLVKF